MSSQRQELLDLLKAHGAVLERRNKHDIWRFPNGKVLTIAHTPGDVQTEENTLHDLKNLLGLSLRGRKAVVGERREKEPPKPKFVGKVEIIPATGAAGESWRKQLAQVKERKKPKTRIYSLEERGLA